MQAPRDIAGPATTPDLSLVIPVHNGAAFISHSVSDARDFLSARRQSFEILIVDDGSDDGTSEAVKPMTGERVRLITLGKNRGKIGAVRAGMAEACGACRIFTDADLPYDLEAVPYIARLVIDHGYHVVVGDRTLSESADLASSRVARKLGSRAYSFFVRMLVTGGLFDSQCGLKGFQADVADALFPLLTDDGFSGDVELLYIALKFNLSIRRIPVRLQRATSTTVKLRRHSLPMLLSILGLRHRWSSGRYTSPALERIASQAYWQARDHESPEPYRGP